MIHITTWYYYYLFFFFRNASTTTYLTTEGGSVKRIFAAMPTSVAASTVASTITQPLTTHHHHHVQSPSFTTSGGSSITLPNSAVTVTPTNAQQQPNMHQPQLQLPMSVAANLLASVTKANVEVTPAMIKPVDLPVNPRVHHSAGEVTNNSSVTVSLTPAPAVPIGVPVSTSIPVVDREEVIQSSHHLTSIIGTSHQSVTQPPSVIVTPAPINFNNGNMVHKSENKHTTVSTKVEVTPILEMDNCSEAKRQKLE